MAHRVQGKRNQTSQRGQPHRSEADQPPGPSRRREPKLFFPGEGGRGHRGCGSAGSKVARGRLAAGALTFPVGAGDKPQGLPPQPLSQETPWGLTLTSPGSNPCTHHATTPTLAPSPPQKPRPWTPRPGRAKPTFAALPLTTAFPVMPLGKAVHVCKGQVLGFSERQRWRAGYGAQGEGSGLAAHNGSCGVAAR